MAQQAKKSKGSRKLGRNSPSCKAYALSKRREHNKLRRLVKHLVLHPVDRPAIAAADFCRGVIRGY